MNRKIKFRAWDDARKEFQEVLGLSYCGTVLDEKFVLQQFTGLKDKNGKDIYEGDIVSFQAKVVSGREFYKNEEVYYSDDNCSFFFGKSVHFAPNEIEDIEVVSNICENSELSKSNGCETEYGILNKSIIEGGLSHEDDVLAPEIILLSNGSHYGDSIVSIKFENHYQILIENERRQEVYGKNVYIEMNKKIIRDLIGKLSYVLNLCKSCSSPFRKALSKDSICF